jgi:flagellar biosynthesis protein FlhF
MKLRTFSAPTMKDAMAQVREAMGDDAIIISTQRSARDRSIQITAAIDPSRSGPAQAASAPPPLNRAELGERVARALAWHGVPPRLVERLSMDALRQPTGTPDVALAGALDLSFRFQPLPTAAGRRPIMLVGPPGAGKTVTVAKLAAQAAMEQREVLVITTDTMRAGGFEQLDAFIRLLGRPLFAADTPDDLSALVRRAGPQALVIIDTPGINPFNSREVDAINALAVAAGANTVLALPAGGDAVETTEIGAAFNLAGARHLLATRLDVSRRLGALIAAADAAGLAFCGATISASVAHGLYAMTSASLAQLILRDPDTSRITSVFQEANAA